MSSRLSVLNTVRRLRLALDRQPAVRCAVIGLAGLLVLLGAWPVALGLLALVGALLRSPWMLLTGEVVLAVWLVRAAPKSTPAVYLTATAITAWVVNDPVSFRVGVSAWLLLTVVFTICSMPKKKGAEP